MEWIVILPELNGNKDYDQVLHITDDDGADDEADALDLAKDHWMLDGYDVEQAIQNALEDDGIEIEFDFDLIYIEEI